MGMGIGNGLSDNFALDLAEALCARLCHDLSGPLGTLAGALEIAAEVGEAVSEDDAALELANEASAQMKDRLRLYRAAWGGGTGAMTAADISALVAPVATPRRIRIETAGLQGALDSDGARLALGLLLLGVEALPRGGELVLAGQACESLIVQPVGPKAAWPEGVMEALADAALPSPTPRGISLVLLALAAKSCAVRLSLSFSGTAESAPPLVASWG